MLLFDIGVEGQTNKLFSFRIFEQQLIPWQSNEDVKNTYCQFLYDVEVLHFQRWVLFQLLFSIKFTGE